MSLKIDHLIPVVVIGLLAFLFIFNNKSMTLSESGNVIIQPKQEIGVIRLPIQKDSEENDNKVTIKHIASGDKLEFLTWHNYIVLPDGMKKLPTKTGVDGKEYAIWEVIPKHRDWIFDPGIYLGTYFGYLSGPIENTNVKHFDVGVKFSPVMIYNTLSPDLLISNQGIGVGLCFHPSEERFGFLHNLDVGYARFYTLNDDAQRNLFYLGFSTRF